MVGGRKCHFSVNVHMHSHAMYGVLSVYSVSHLYMLTFTHCQNN